MSEDASRNGSLDHDVLRLAIRQEMDVPRSTVPGVLKLWSRPSPSHDIRLIPPAGFRRAKSCEHLKAKQSLLPQPSPCDSDWPLANQQVVG